MSIIFNNTDELIANLAKESNVSDTYNEKALNIEAKLFEVVKLPLMPQDSIYTSPTAFGLFDSDGGPALGVVGKVNTPTQPKTLFDNFIDLANQSNLNLDTLEYTELKDKQRIMFSIELGEFSYKNLRGKDDVMKTKLNAITGYDGTTKTGLFLSSYRLICSNGMKGWNTDVITDFKNTTNNQYKVNILIKEMGKMIKKNEDFTVMMEHLSKRKVTRSEQQKFMNKVLKIDTLKGATKNQENKLELIQQAFEQEIVDADRTAWALLNGVTRYTNHNVKTNTKDVNDYIYCGTGLEINNLAQKAVLEMFA